MIREWKVFLSAIMFLTRLPVPKGMEHRPEYLSRSPRYFPVVGWIVGLISVLVYWIFDRYISQDTGILASILAGIFVTGAFHEDGLADVCDGFGGGWTSEKILAIMKDSRLGTYGVIGLVGALSAKFLLIRELPGFTPDLAHPSSNPLLNYRYFICSIIAAHSISRLMPLFLLRYSTYVSDQETGKSKMIANARPGWGSLILASLFALVPFLFLSWHFLLAILPAAYITYELSAYFRKWIGGYTGDCLGAVQQLSELAFYLGVIIVWRYIA
jgi:adenosylcobinamide-GDP ribazoletransferase